MAKFFLSIKTHSRSKGANILQLASAQEPGGLTDSSGILQTTDITRPVLRNFILAPVQCPAILLDRATLWNAVVAMETRIDAQFCRSVQLLLPPELGLDGQDALLRDFVEREFVALGMIADCAIWITESATYATVLLGTRSVTPDGLGFKDRSWNNRRYSSLWRKAWEEITNKHLAVHGVPAEFYIDRRSKDARAVDGIDLESYEETGRDQKEKDSGF